MRGPVRLLDPMLLAEVGPTLLTQLDALRLPEGRFAVLLRERPEALAVVALDAAGAVGWAAAEPDGLCGVYVAPRARRRGIGRRLALAIVRAAYEGSQARWKVSAWRTSTRPGSVGRRFWDAVFPGMRRAA